MPNNSKAHVMSAIRSFFIHSSNLALKLILRIGYQRFQSITRNKDYAEVIHVDTRKYRLLFHLAQYASHRFLK